MEHLRRIKEINPKANIVAIDYDPSATKVNQENRIKLMLEIAKERIAYRVAHGGHGIPDEDVERRYVESGQHLKEILNLCDMAIMYDNTLTVPTGDDNLKQVQINFTIKDWGVE